MKIVFAESLGMCECAINTQLKSLIQQGHTLTFYPDRDENEDVLIQRAQNAEVVAISNIPLRKRFFENCPNLKMLSVGFTGIDHIDLDECRKRGITVCNAAGYATQAVAELAIGMMLSVYRRIVGADATIRIGGDRQGVLGCELHGKTVGIIGMGAIGQQVALLANAFGCQVVYYNRSSKNIPNARQVDKATLLNQSDIITIHTPLTSETSGFIGADEFAQMQSHAILINTARGPVVKQEALYNALRKGLIAGAAVDVYDQEPPLPGNFDLFNAPNLLMLPHMGYATKEAFGIRLNIVAKNIEMWLAGTPQNKII